MHALVPVNGTEKQRQIDNAKAVKARLSGQTVDKVKIHKLTQEVRELRSALKEASFETSEAALMEIRNLSGELEESKEKYNTLVAALTTVGLSNLVNGKLAELETVAPLTPASSIIHAVTIVSGINANKRHSDRRQSHLVFWRAVEHWVLKERTRRSYPSIGRITGGRDHSTIIHSVRKVANNYEAYQQAIEAVEDLL